MVYVHVKTFGLHNSDAVFVSWRFDSTAPQKYTIFYVKLQKFGADIYTKTVCSQDYTLLPDCSWFLA